MLKRIYFLLALLMAFASARNAVAHVNAGGNAVGIEDYRRALLQALDLARQATDESLDTSQKEAKLKQAADVLAGVQRISLPTGQQVAINNTALIGELRDGTLDAADAMVRLTTLRDAIDHLASLSTANDRAKLNALLVQPPFIDEPRNWFLAWLEVFFASVFGSLGKGISNSRLAIVIGGLAILGAVLFFFVRSLRNNLATEVALPVDPDDDVPATSAAALTRAQTLAGAGDYRSAVRQLYLATLLLLDERGALKFDKSLTNRETLRAVSRQGAPALADALRPIVDVYDRVWYGFAHIAGPEFEQYRNQVEALQAVRKR